MNGLRLPDNTYRHIPCKHIHAVNFSMTIRAKVQETAKLVIAEVNLEECPYSFKRHSKRRITPQQKRRQTNLPLPNLQKILHPKLRLQKNDGLTPNNCLCHATVLHRRIIKKCSKIPKNSRNNN